MQKIHSCRKYVGINGDGAGFGGFYIDYYILRSEITVPGVKLSRIMYGIEIEKKYEEDGMEKILEQAIVNDIYPSESLTQILINKLSQRLVAPSMLKYILNDILGENGLELPEVTLTVV